MKVFIAYGCREDQVIALRTQVLASASGIKTSLNYLDCDAILAIADAGVDKNFAEVLTEAKAQGKQIFFAGSQSIPPDFINHNIVLPSDALRVMTALGNLASAMCELREVTK